MAAGYVLGSSAEDIKVCELYVYTDGSELFFRWFHGQFLNVHFFEVCSSVTWLAS